MVSEEKKEIAVLNLANGLSILRMLLAPVFMLLLFQDKKVAAFIVLLIATVTDFLDGQVARIWKMQTRFGKMLDPVADKIIISFAVIALVVKYKFPLWVAMLIVLRDSLLLIVGSIYLAKNRKKVLKPNLLGKITTFFQMSTLVVFILEIEQIIKNILLLIVLLFTIASGIVYLIKGFGLFNIKRPKRWINLPNKITILRITLIPIFVLFLLSKIPFRGYAAATIFVILALSDALDGYLARKRREITNFGELVDPVADKLLVSSALIFLIGKGIEPWIAFTIIAREFLVTGLRMLALSKGSTIPARLSGKIKTVAQVIGITSVILHFQYADYLMLVAVIVTIYSGTEYIWLGRDLIKRLT